MAEWRAMVAGGRCVASAADADSRPLERGHENMTSVAGASLWWRVAKWQSGEWHSGSGKWQSGR